MAIAAVPDYLGRNHSTASPGDRFTLFLRLWGENQRSGELLWTTHDETYEMRGTSRQERTVKRHNGRHAIDGALGLTPDDQERMVAIAQREKALVSLDTLVISTISSAPFTTGLGIEHPLENGFAFLNPYGLPYLPGSSIKGVLRKAAQELARGLFGGTQGWNDTIVTALFGLECDDPGQQHQRGTLCFWDVIPQIKDNKLTVEIMTPHQSHYLQGRDSPHDNGSPNPIHFLAVPAGSGFTFHIDCDRGRLKQLAPGLIADKPIDDGWRLLINAAFEHAFDWLGFGAKTAIGYGAMDNPMQRKRNDERQREQAARDEADRLAAKAEAARATHQTWNTAVLSYAPNSGHVTAIKDHLRSVGIKLADVETQLGELGVKRIKDKKELKNVTVIVEPIGRNWQIVSVSWTPPA